MAKKLYLIGIDTIKKFISTNRADINALIKNNLKFELAKNFGRTHYEFSIEQFFIKYKINKDIDYAIQVLNIFKSSTFILELYNLLDLEQFENKELADSINENSKKDYYKSIFYSLIYFLSNDSNEYKEKIKTKLLSEYFLHHLASINKNSPIQINYQNLTSGLIKSKKLILKESYKTDEATSIVTFKIFVNYEQKVVLQGKSIKTLRKKAFKQIFFHLLDNY